LNPGHAGALRFCVPQRTMAVCRRHPTSTAHLADNPAADAGVAAVAGVGTLTCDEARRIAPNIARVVLRPCWLGEHRVVSA
jgi:hypothetical protein